LGLLSAYSLYATTYISNSLLSPLKKPQTINVQGPIISNIMISNTIFSIKYMLAAFYDMSVKRYFEIKNSGMYRNTPE